MDVIYIYTYIYIWFSWFILLVSDLNYSLVFFLVGLSFKYKITTSVCIFYLFLSDSFTVYSEWFWVHVALAGITGRRAITIPGVCSTLSLRRHFQHPFKLSKAFLPAHSLLHFTDEHTWELVYAGLTQHFCCIKKIRYFASGFHVSFFPLSFHVTPFVLCPRAPTCILYQMEDDVPYSPWV